MSGSRKSILMLQNTGKLYNVVGKAIRADGYFGMTDGLHTVQASFTNFTGGFGVQGTLSLSPKDKDWFWIELKQITDFDAQPFITFPRDPLAPTGAQGSNPNFIGDTGNLAWTFTGNLTYVRAVVIREYMGLISADYNILGKGNIIDTSRMVESNGIYTTPMSTVMLDTYTSLGSVDRVLVCL